MAESSDAITGKFDFYDILGYLVPGLALLGLAALPFGLIKGIWPSTSFTSAVLYLVAAHILGNILQGFLRAWESAPEIRDNKGKWRYPSSVLLDADQRSLQRLRTKIGELVEKSWKIPAADLLADDHDSDRNTAFLQARNLLLQSKKESYFEQFEGKYALMGGMTVSLLVAALYYAGWALALMHSEHTSCFGWLAHILMPYLFVLAIYLVIFHIIDAKSDEEVSKKTKRVLHVILLLLLGFGAIVGGFIATSASPKNSEAPKSTEIQKVPCVGCVVSYIANSESSKESAVSPALQIEHQAPFMLTLALVAFAAAIRCYGAYKAFAREFAMGVWRDFANFELVCESANKSAGENPSGDGPNDKSKGEDGPT